MARSHSGMTWKLKFRPAFLKFLPLAYSGPIHPGVPRSARSAWPPGLRGDSGRFSPWPHPCAAI